MTFPGVVDSFVTVGLIIRSDISESMGLTAATLAAIYRPTLLYFCLFCFYLHAHLHLSIFVYFPIFYCSVLLAY